MTDIQQLIKKNTAASGGYNDIFPKTFLDAVRDRQTGETLTDILAGFNMYYLPYAGSKKDTRLQVPKFLRRKGLIITYVTYDSVIVTEGYKQDSIDDITWGIDSSWDTLWNTNNYVKNSSGTSENRPSLSAKDIGFIYFDTTLDKPIYWNGSKWVDSTGAGVVDSNSLEEIPASQDTTY